MLELFIAALIQLSVLTSGSTTSTKAVTAPTKQVSVQSATAPTCVTSIGGTGWDDRN